MARRNTKEPVAASNFTVAIVGGGLVGCLSAVYFAKRGWNVNIYERREDIRLDTSYSGRSINLALSVRGLAGLKGAGVDSIVLENMIPMKGRMIHTTMGELMSQPYGLFGECINSVDRKLINEHLLNEVERMPNVNLYFHYNLIQSDFDGKTLLFGLRDGTQVTKQADLVVGADGAFSRVRTQLMRATRQVIYYCGYVELTIPAGPRGYLMDSHHLHIWPRHTFMLIALPNIDKSFTVTLFMPWSGFDAIKTELDLVTFFEKTFPDALALIGRELLVQEYFGNPKGSLISLKANPWHHLDRVVIMGDAAHAMVPFYGQGLNCGFEDCLVLDTILSKHLGTPGSSGSTNPTPVALSAALAEFTSVRQPDAEAICDLAMHNFVEMSASVVEWSYLLRKKVEGWLHRLMPVTVIPLYTMVSFTRIPYSDVVRRWKRQTRWLNIAGYAGLGLASAITCLGFAVAWKRSDDIRDVVEEYAGKIIPRF
ncbi:kynurenine 3-monooxygenase [Synchytrium microbalum]|uniref:Kynurenine 3-monooxygenase n=1 Tax=Synchytrium microbalum TaxID=1806994 RepID=A0A507CF04_9FUNG|nr:kynurenine 3-monooxygenase [Synchytrium microbalum]TPX38071.1 kynurenine 3-monooxygenase [Synchytrium microbalum]